MGALNLKLLAIDDNPDNLTSLRAAVRSALPGCTLSTAVPGRGLDLARAEDPDVILLDITTAGADGFDICRTLKADTRLRDTPLVFLTAPGTDTQSHLKALEAGADGFLSLPLQEEELPARIASMARLKEVGRAQRLRQEALALTVAERTREFEQQLAERRRAEEALRESEAFTRAVLDNLPVGIAVNSVDPGVSFTYMNDRFADFYRTTREKLARPDAFWEAVYEDPELRQVIKARVLEDCASGDPERMHWEDVPIARRGEETTFIAARDIPVPGKPLMVSLVWDVTERKLGEQALRSANRALRAVSECSQAVVRATDEATLLRDVCRHVVELGGYRMAWVGLAEDDADRSVRPVAWAGAEDGYLESVRISWADTQHEKNPTGTAIRECRPVLGHQTAAEATSAPWREAALQRGFASAIALPLLGDERHAIGALTIHAAAEDAFDDDEVRLLTELADTLAHGLRALRDRAAREKAERALRQSADEYRELFEAESDAIFLIDNESGRLLQANQAACALYGYTREELLGMRNVDLSAEPAQTREVTQHTPPVASRVVTIPIRWHKRKDGTILPVEITGRFFLRDGQPVHIAAIRDITARQQTEARMAEQLDELRRWHDATLGRESRVLELKKEVNELLATAGQPPRYPSALDGEASVTSHDASRDGGED